MLIFPQLKFSAVKCLAQLGLQVVINLVKMRMIPKKDLQFMVIDAFLPLHLTHHHAVDIPDKMDQGALFQQVIPILLLEDKFLYVDSVIVDLNGDSLKYISLCHFPRFRFSCSWFKHCICFL